MQAQVAAVFVVKAGQCGGISVCGEQIEAFAAVGEIKPVTVGNRFKHGHEQKPFVRHRLQINPV
jgi:hypothetical protein